MYIVGTNAPEYQTLVECTPKLTALLKHDVLNLGDHLFSQALISKNIYDQIVVPTIDEQHKVSLLVSYLTDRVKTNPSAFNEFLSVLKALGSWTNDIVEDLDKVYAKNCEGTICMFCAGRSYHSHVPYLSTSVVTSGFIHVHAQHLHNHVLVRTMYALQEPLTEHSAIEV